MVSLSCFSMFYCNNINLHPVVELYSISLLVVDSLSVNLVTCIGMTQAFDVKASLATTVTLFSGIRKLY